MGEIEKYGTDQSDKYAISQMEVGRLSCNSLIVNHYFQLGNFYASYNQLKNLKDDSRILTLEKIK